MRKVLLLAKQTQAHAEKTCGVGIEMTQKLHEETWNAASDLCWQSVQDPCHIVFENADVYGIEVHDVRTWKFVDFRKMLRFFLHYTRDVTREARGHNSPGAESLRGTKKSQLVSERPQVQTCGRQTSFLPQALSNLVTPMHITIVYPKWRNSFTKIPAHQGQTINHKLFKTNAADYQVIWP